MKLLAFLLFSFFSFCFLLVVIIVFYFCPNLFSFVRPWLRCNHFEQHCIPHFTFFLLKKIGFTKSKHFYSLSLSLSCQRYKSQISDFNSRIFSASSNPSHIYTLLTRMVLRERKIMQIADGLNVPFPDLNFHFGWPGGLVDAVTVKIVEIFSFWAVLPFPRFLILKFWIAISQRSSLWPPGTTLVALVKGSKIHLFFKS